VKRRAAEISTGPANTTDDPRSLRYASKVAAQRLIDYTAKHYSTENKGETKELRRRLLQAASSIRAHRSFSFSPAPSRRSCWRSVRFFLMPMLLKPESSMLWPRCGSAASLGYFAPSVYLSRRIAGLQVEHRSGFPDFMDLLVVVRRRRPQHGGRRSTASGASLRTPIARSPPTVHMATLEMRAGRTLSETLDHLCRPARPGGGALVRDPAAAIRESSAPRSPRRCASIPTTCATSAFRAPRKRPTACRQALGAADLCVFPVVIIVIMLPVYVKLKLGTY
jgi:tight adherence protein C